MPNEKFINNLYKIDITTRRRAFNILFKHLFTRGEASLGEVTHLLSGVRKNGSKTQKLTRSEIKGILRMWHRQKYITIFRGRVRLCGFHLIWHLVDEETIRELAKNSTEFWLSHAPHGLRGEQNG